MDEAKNVCRHFIFSPKNKFSSPLHQFSANHAQERTSPLKLLSCSSIPTIFRSDQNEDIKLKTDEDLQVQEVSKSEKDQINEKSPMKSEKDRVKTKSLRSEEDIFGDTEKDLDEDAAFVSNMVIGDTLSYTAMVCTSQNVFC